MEHSWLQILGWTLLHACWQGLLISLIWAIAKSFLKHSSAQKRYLASMGALFALLLCSLITFWKLLPAHIPTLEFSPIENLTSSPLPDFSPTDTTLSIETEKNWIDLLNLLAPWFSIFWMLGACLMGIRLKKIDYPAKQKGMGHLADTGCPTSFFPKNKVRRSGPIREITCVREIDVF